MKRRRLVLTTGTILLVVITSTMLLVSGTMAGSGKEPVPVNINTADVGILTTLPGIGSAKAAAIVQYRDEYGPFANVDDLIKVRGISMNLLEKIRDLVQTQ